MPIQITAYLMDLHVLSYVLVMIRMKGAGAAGAGTISVAGTVAGAAGAVYSEP